MKYADSIVLELGKKPGMIDIDKIKKKGFLYILSNVGDNYVDATKKDQKFKIPAEASVVIRLKHLWKADYITDFHTKFYLRRLADYIIYDTTDDPADYEDEMAALKNKFKGWGVDLGSDGDLDRIKKFKDFYDEEPEFIFTPLNPIKYKKRIINYCKKNNIKLVAYDIYGTRFFNDWMIETFTTDYLEKFAASKSTGITLSTDMDIRDLAYSLVSICDQYGFLGEEIPEEYEKLFNIERDIWKDPGREPVRKVVSISNGGIPGDSKFSWLPEKNSLGNVTLGFKEFSSPQLSESHKESARELEDYQLPENMTLFDYKKYTDMIGLSVLAVENPGYKLTYNISGDITTVLLSSKYLPWRKKKLFAIVYNQETRNPILLKLG